MWIIFSLSVCTTRRRTGGCLRDVITDTCRLRDVVAVAVAVATAVAVAVATRRRRVDRDVVTTTASRLRCDVVSASNGVTRHRSTGCDFVSVCALSLIRRGDVLFGLFGGGSWTIVGDCLFLFIDLVFDAKSFTCSLLLLLLDLGLSLECIMTLG